MPMGGDDMAKTKYKIILSDNDIEMLNSILADDEPSDRIKLRARILLLSDENPSDRTKETGKVFSTSPPLSKQIESVITDNPLFHYISR